MRTGFILDGNFLTDSRVKNEARILEQSGHQVFVLNHLTGNSPSVSEFSENITLIRTSFPKRISNYLFALENLIPVYDHLWCRDIRRMVKEYGIDVLHAHDLYLARASGKIARELKIPLVLDLHENYPAAINEYRWATRFPARMIVQPGKWKLKEKEYLSFADKIIVLSTSFKSALLSEYPEIDSSSIHVYPNVPDIVNLSSYKIMNDIFPHENKKIILYFGVISRRRGILTSLQALRIALTRHPDLHLILIGPVDKAEKADFNRLFNEPGIKNHLTHYAWKDISELPSYISIADICISPLIRNPQHDSGIANKVFQYMLFAKPLIVSDCIPQVELVKTTGCGVVFRDGDAVEMASRISELLSDPAFCRVMGEKGRKAVTEEYNTEIQGREIIKAYKELT
jgi:glycosyltransferase involved in cell wall biosynthesis